MAAFTVVRRAQNHARVVGLFSYSRQHGIHIQACCHRIVRQTTVHRFTRSTLGSRWQAMQHVPSIGGALTTARHNSTDTGQSAQVSENLIDAATPLIDPSAITEVAMTAEQILQPVKEIPFAELGLGGFSPVGLLQHALEFLHMSAGLPWWAAIATGTVIARVCVFPLIVRNMRYAANLNNVMPTFQKLTAKMNEAKQTGNQAEVMKRSLEVQQFMKKHDVNPLKSLLGIVVQAPIFISFFVGLRRMASLPVASMTTGGLWWFTDLTTSDPYYIMPVLASLSMLAVLELGGEAGVSSAQMQKMKTIFRIMPFALLPLIASMPKAVFVYWLTSNIFSISQVAILKIPAVRTRLNIPEKIKHNPQDMPKSEGFIQSMKSGWKNAQTNHEVEQKGKAHLQSLKEAGTGPVPQTFTYDPTRQHIGSPAQSISTSSKTAKDVRRKRVH
ncbi:mitochondrial inner membrane protein OXA1L-like [Patiria miniata]|uniref:Membrane insertase YidC/Oxa/ALB C-terminal domain-containing protein n=1 Tax=Patiria miniata TaxID=46514 RepID=A0A914B0J0_PATMI|nr:mitochondrial inner membrane protein OXA1L-like [Patiria miniata]